MYAYANNTFYPFSLRESYEAAGTWPESFAEVEDEVFGQYSGLPPAGKARGADDNGQPAWIDLPPPTQEEVMRQAEAEKQFRINQANAYMNSKQWSGKAAIGRLKGDELALYNLWLDYLDALEAVDTSNAPDINWPEQPE